MSIDVAAQIDLWRGKLLDTSKRNRLISFGTGRAGGIRLVYPDIDTIWGALISRNGAMTFCRKAGLLGEPRAEDGAWEDGDEQGGEDPRLDLDDSIASPRLRPDHILTELSDKHLAARLRRLDLNARTAMAEAGVPTLFLVVGLLRWYESKDSATELLAPLTLVPAYLGRENVEAPWVLAIEDDEVASNHSLIQMLGDGFDIEMPPVPDDLALDEPRCRERYYSEVRRSIRGPARWEVLDEAALGTFSFQKVAMWKDLVRNKASIAAHDLCRAAAGDPNGRLAGPPASRSPTSSPSPWRSVRRSCSSARRRRRWRWSSAGSTTGASATSAWSATATRPTREPSSRIWVAASNS